MSESPEEFFETYVRRSYSDWKASRTDAYLARIVSHKLNVLAERAFKYWSCVASQKLLQVTGNISKERFDQFRQLLADKCTDTALIRDIDDGHKHLAIDRRTRQVTRDDQTSLGSFSWDDAPWDEAAWDGEEQLIITLDNGNKRSLEAVIENVYGFWEDILTGKRRFP